MAFREISYLNEFKDTILGLAWETTGAKANLLILTGMQETSYRYDDFATFLNSNGFNVYCLDHYGQGRNILGDEAKGIWPIAAFSKSIKTFAAFAKKLSEDNKLPTYVFGHSMGSFMTQDFIAKFPGLTKKAIICGTDFPSPGLMSFGYNVSKLKVNKKNRDNPNKGLAKLVTGSFAKKVKDRKTDFDWLSYNTENVKKYIADPKCGFVATGGFYQEFLKGVKDVAKKDNLNKIDKKTSVLIIAGKEDPVGHNGKGPTKVYETYKKLGLTDVTLKLYGNMRHEILNENDKRNVYNEILGFLIK